jgi:hypothetical protein
MLSERRQAILRSIVEQYIDRAMPVPSQYIVDKYKLAVSSATVRNEMAALEDEGFIYARILPPAVCRPIKATGITWNHWKTYICPIPTAF